MRRNNNLRNGPPGLNLGLGGEGRQGGTDTNLPGVDGDCLCAVVRFVDADQTIGQFKHVVTQTDDDELGILGPLLRRNKEQNKQNTEKKERE